LEKAKPIAITKKLVWESYQRVKANRGAAGVDEQSVEDFEKNLKGNLYKIWNRMSSGSYFPPAIRGVPIPKGNGKLRILGIPTVADRTAQMVVKTIIEPRIEPHFDEDSFGYRPKKSAHDALAKARQRCWKYDWVVDIDICGFFDNLDHALVLKALSHHVKETWILLYTERWLKAPIQHLDGRQESREKGTPQGGVVSPILANLFLHYAFDKWMRKAHSRSPFERYADDIVVHCRTRDEAERLLAGIRNRLRECLLELNEEKTKIVYCKDSNRRGVYPEIKFDFLGFTFRPRLSMNSRQEGFVSFSPAISQKAAKYIRQEIRKWKIHKRTDKTITDLARMFNPYIRGWINYYGRFYRGAIYEIFRRLDLLIVRWIRYKYKRFFQRPRAAKDFYWAIAKGKPHLFAHWTLWRWLNVGSRMS
jgi:RNA-directed DNA polymerase